MNQFIDSTYDTIKGELNRICVTDNYEELCNMYNYLKKNIKSLYDYKKRVLFGLDQEEGDNNAR